MDNLRFWSSILKQKEEIPNVIGTYLDWKQCEWLLIGMAQTLNNTNVYVLIEYCEDAEPQTGLSQIVVTEDELSKYFIEDRKRK